jgi:F-type H+-transporting ATPase subunit epsilon
MKTFPVVFQDAAGSDTIEGVVSFIGEDRSGSFAVRHGHARFVTALVMGLARLRLEDDSWRYVALPGAVACFDEGTMTVATRRYLIGDDFNEISEALEVQLASEERKLASIRQGLRRMEQHLLERIREMGRAGE